ncbi:hypothetical protein BC835DRAFT_1521855 [Cytidiella melzeri]|nr:hypothetical protein BC835DRAFT_1521855 [Cytidiella melzeri]
MYDQSHQPHFFAITLAQAAVSELSFQISYQLPISLLIMHFSTTLMLFVAIVTGMFHTVTVSAIPLPPFSSSHNILEGQSTGEHVVIQSPVPTAPLTFHYKKSYQPMTADHDPEFDRQRLQYQARGPHHFGLEKLTSEEVSVPEAVLVHKKRVYLSPKIVTSLASKVLEDVKHNNAGQKPQHPGHSNGIKTPPKPPHPRRLIASSV